MSEPLLQLSDAANWQQVYNDEIVADDAPHGRYYPIQSFVVPALLTSPILCLGASSLSARPHWKLGFYARQYLGSTGLGAIETNSYRAFLDRLVLARFQLFSPQYQLRIEIPFWHQRMSIGIWEYSGAIGDTTEQLIIEQSEITRADVARVEAAINSQG